MVVIGEEYLLMNLLMDTLCLTAAMRLSSLRARPGRVLLAALAGALLSMIALSLWGLRASAYAAQGRAACEVTFDLTDCTTDCKG